MKSMNKTNKRMNRQNIVVKGEELEEILKNNKFDKSCRKIYLLLGVTIVICLNIIETLYHHIYH